MLTTGIRMTTTIRLQWPAIKPKISHRSCVHWQLDR